MSRLINGLESIIEWFGQATAWICLLIVLVVANNVILRYFFGLGPVSLQELEWHLMSPIALIGMSYALHRGVHVRVDIFYDRFSPKNRALIDIVTGIMTIAISIVIVQLSWGFVYQAYAIGEGSPDPGGLPYRFLLRSFIPLGFVLLAIQALALALKNVLIVQGKG